MSYKQDRDFSDGHLDFVRRILGRYFLVNAPFRLDTQQATDLVTITAGNIKTAVRIRRNNYLDRYKYDFTLRSYRSGNSDIMNTEYQKILSGYADYLFYGHSRGLSSPPDPWYLISLDHFRQHVKGPHGQGIRRGENHAFERNGSKTWFHWFDVRTFPQQPPILVAASEQVPMQSTSWQEPAQAQSSSEDQLQLPLE